MFFDPIRERDIKLHVLLGNHDCYYKTNNEVNSMTLTCAEYPLRLYEDIPEVVEIGGTHVLFIPWISPANMHNLYEYDKEGKSRCCYGSSSFTRSRDDR